MTGDCDIKQLADTSRVDIAPGLFYIERPPMNWGKNLTLLGAMRLTGWVRSRRFRQHEQAALRRVAREEAASAAEAR